jgi:hypothetical protein
MQEDKLRIPTRFYAVAQDEDAKTFIGYPRHLRYHGVILSDGAEYILRKYDAFWLVHAYINLTESKTMAPRLAGAKVLTHEVISPQAVSAYRYVITDTETILHMRTYEQDGLMGNGFVLYMVADPHRSKGFFMLPTEYRAFRRFSPDYPDISDE